MTPTRRPSSSEGSAEDYLAAANFESTSRVCTFRRFRPDQILLYSGSTLVAEGDTLSYSLLLPKHSGRLLHAPRAVCVEGDVRVSATPDGATYVVNIGQKPARVRFAQDKDVGRIEEIVPEQIKEI